MIVENYFEHVLMPCLAQQHVEHLAILKICGNIRCQMESLLSLWTNTDKRDAILFLSKEQAPFYKPKGNHLVAEFVVTTIRNSLLETAASVGYSSLGLSQMLTNEQIKLITSSAIVYFNKHSFADMVKETPFVMINVYESAIRKYPLAWKALFTIANMQCDALDVDFQPQSPKNDMPTLPSECIQNNKVVADGYSMEFDHALIETLDAAISGQINSFLVDNSKCLTRNFEKYLRVLDILLSHNVAFSTCNYYISNKRLEKRKTFLRASHDTKDAIKNAQNFAGAPPHVKAACQNILHSYFENKMDFIKGEKS